MMRERYIKSDILISFLETNLVNITLRAGRNKTTTKGRQCNLLTVSLVDKTAPVDPNSFVEAAAGIEKWVTWVSRVLGACPLNCVGFHRFAPG